METFEGKVAVVTGAASGIGLAIARALAAEGAHLVLADVEEAALDVAVAELGTRTEVLGRRCDVSDRTQVEALGAAAMERFGALHLAVNNAGVAGGGLSWEIPVAEWDWVLGVDLWGVIHGVAVFTPLIIESGGGHVVNTASMAGLTAPPFMAPYNVAKHGVVALSETMFHELALTHPEVGVTVVCPGWVRTRIHESGRNRPGADAAEADAPEAAALAAVVGPLIAGGIEPDDVAGQVLDAIRERRFAVLTHPDWSAGITRRADLLVSGRNPEPVALPES